MLKNEYWVGKCLLEEWKEPHRIMIEVLMVLAVGGKQTIITDLIYQLLIWFVLERIMVCGWVSSSSRWTTSWWFIRLCSCWTLSARKRMSIYLDYLPVFHESRSHLENHSHQCPYSRKLVPGSIRSPSSRCWLQTSQTLNNQSTQSYWYRLFGRCP